MISFWNLPSRRRLLLNRLLLTVVVGGLLAGACTRPIDRPRDGAQPLAAGAGAGRLLPDPPATLAPAASFAITPTVEPPPAPPSPVVQASPGRGGIVYPIVSNIQPTPGAALPPGDVIISARVTGSNILVSIMAFVNDEPYQPPLTIPPSRSVSFSFVRQLELGPQEVRIEARDQGGQLGDYRWQFTVGPRPPPPPVVPRSNSLPTIPLPTVPPPG